MKGFFLAENSNPADMYLFKVNNENTKTMCQNCSKLTNKDTRTIIDVDGNQWSRSGNLLLSFNTFYTLF